MGITIHYKAVQSGYKTVKAMLDRTQLLGEKFQKEARLIKIPFEIIRKSDTRLYFNVGGCETLSFDFKTASEWQKDDFYYGYFLEAFGEVKRGEFKRVLDEGYRVDDFPQNLKLYSSGFCKTQFAKSLVEHKWIAELVRSVCMYCQKANVDDEGDYYHTGAIEDASEAINQNGKLIDSIGSMLSAQGFDYQKGGSSKIKSMR